MFNYIYEFKKILKNHCEVKNYKIYDSCPIKYIDKNENNILDTLSIIVIDDKKIKHCFYFEYDYKYQKTMLTLNITKNGCIIDTKEYVGYDIIKNEIINL